MGFYVVKIVPYSLQTPESIRVIWFLKHCHYLPIWFEKILKSKSVEEDENSCPHHEIYVHFKMQKLKYLSIIKRKNLHLKLFKKEIIKSHCSVFIQCIYFAVPILKKG